MNDLFKEIFISKQMIYKCSYYFSLILKHMYFSELKLNSFYDVY